MNDGPKSLILAAKEGALETVKRLIKTGSSINETAYGGWSALHLAAKANHLEIAKELIKHNAELNISDPNDHYTPLHLAAKEGHREMVAFLIEAGADKTLLTKQGKTFQDLYPSSKPEDEQPYSSSSSSSKPRR